MRTRGDEVARENITQKGKKKKKAIDALSCSSSSPALPLLTPLSAALPLFHFDCSVQSRSRREGERERGRKRDGERDGGEVEERNERVVTGSVCV